jgi:transcriptional regulator with GAF, ATPase, and Fis domain
MFLAYCFIRPPMQSRCLLNCLPTRMTAELIAIRGPLLGARFKLSSGESQIGRAPSSAVRLPETDAPWRHCAIEKAPEGFVISDLRSGQPTLVNGSRVVRQLLHDGDQIGAGETTLVFRAREEDGSTPEETHATLMRACAVLALFRALAVAEDPTLYRSLEARAADLIRDLMPCDEILVLLGSTPDEILQAAAVSSADRDDRGFEALRPVLERISREGTIEDGASCVASPLFVREKLAGAIVARAVERGEAGSARLRETLSAVATLASAALESARDVESLRTEKALLLEELRGRDTSILGDSPAIHKLLQMIDRLAPQATTVLVLGESGTGKELVARTLHDRSPRRERPFVAINCAAVTDTLLESELFGHEKGAFTGAIAQKKGKLEMAEGGTVFLDEVGELAPGLQAKLLRVLQQREFERVGGTRTIPLDVRLLAATNRDLAQEVKRGAFREDLYHRLNVVTVRTPPLREHREDIPKLARHFAAAAAVRCGRRIEGVSSEAERYLVQYAWPGNVREMQNAMERAVVLGADSGWIHPEDLPETILETGPGLDTAAAFHLTVADAKRDSIVRAWQESKGDYKAAAAILGLHPNSLLRLIRNLNLRDTLAGGSGR